MFHKKDSGNLHFRATLTQGSRAMEGPSPVLKPSRKLWHFVVPWKSLVAQIGKKGNIGLKSAFYQVIPDIIGNLTTFEEDIPAMQWVWGTQKEDRR